MDPVFPDCFPPLLVMVMYQLLPCLKIFEHLICYQAGEKLLSCDITIIASLHFVSQLHLSILCQNLQSWAFFINISQLCVLQLSSIFFSFRQLKTMHFTTLTRVSCEMQSFDLSKKNPAANWGVKMVWHCRNSWQTSLTWRRAQQELGHFPTECFTTEQYYLLVSCDMQSLELSWRLQPSSLRGSNWCGFARAPGKPFWLEGELSRAGTYPHCAFPNWAAFSPCELGDAQFCFV